MKKPELESKVFRYIRDNALLEAGDDVTVALSGGSDSVALLWVLRALAPQLGIRLRAAHFHHGMRGAEADRDAEFCRGLCAQWEIPFLLGRGDALARAAQTGESREEAARVLRYAFLTQAASGKLATAHNADDQAETMMLHLLRGTGLRGLGGIPPRRENIVRPLLSCTRAEIETLLDAHGLPHVEDSTNASDDCLRNRLRHGVLPLLRAENPGLSRTLGRTADLLRAEDAYLSRLAAEAAEACRAEDGYVCTALRGLDPVLCRRVLIGALRARGLENPSTVYVDALQDLLTAGPSASLDLPNGLKVRRVYDRLCFGPADDRAPLPETVLQVPGTTVLPGELGQINCFFTKNLNNFQKKHTTFALKCDMIASREMIARGRRPGDRLTLPGGTKSVRALMIDRKLPAHLRASVPVLTAAGRPVAVFGVGADPSWIAAADEEALIVELIPGPALRVPN